MRRLDRRPTNVIWRRWRSSTTSASARENWIGDAHRFLIKGGNVVAYNRWDATIRPCLKPRYVANMPYVAFAMVSWRNCCSVLSRAALRSGAGNADASVDGSVYYGLMA